MQNELNAAGCSESILISNQNQFARAARVGKKLISRERRADERARTIAKQREESEKQKKDVKKKWSRHRIEIS
jgi:hypothetical protein